MAMTGRTPLDDRVYRDGVKVNKESAAKKKPRQRGKTNIGVLIDAEVWKRFRMHCLEHDESPGSLLTKVIRAYLDKQGGKKA